MKRHNLLQRSLAFIAIFGSASHALAHPGHGLDTGSTTLHYVASPLHLPAGILLVSLAVLLGLFISSQRTQLAK